MSSRSGAERKIGERVVTDDFEWQVEVEGDGRGTKMTFKLDLEQGRDEDEKKPSLKFTSRVIGSNDTVYHLQEHLAAWEIGRTILTHYARRMDQQSLAGDIRVFDIPIYEARVLSGLQGGGPVSTIRLITRSWTEKRFTQRWDIQGGTIVPRAWVCGETDPHADIQCYTDRMRPGVWSLTLHATCRMTLSTHTLEMRFCKEGSAGENFISIESSESPRYRLGLSVAEYENFQRAKADGDAFVDVQPDWSRVELPDPHWESSFNPSDGNFSLDPPEQVAMPRTEPRVQALIIRHSRPFSIPPWSPPSIGNV